MVTAESVKAKLQGLIATANATTGNADADLTAAINALVAGFGQGGGDSSADGVLDRSAVEYENNTLQLVGMYAFNNCSNLKTLKLTAVTELASAAIYGCSKLENVWMPALEVAGVSSFIRCSALRFADFPVLRIIAAYCFELTALDTLVLRKADAVCELKHVGAFASTPFAAGGTGGTLYVPAALVESYKTATNWSSLYQAGTCNIVAIEGSEYE